MAAAGEVTGREGELLGVGNRGERLRFGRAPREAHGVVHDDGLAALKRAERHLAKHGERV